MLPVAGKPSQASGEINVDPSSLLVLLIASMLSMSVELDAESTAPSVTGRSNRVTCLLWKKAKCLLLGRWESVLFVTELKDGTSAWLSLSTKVSPSPVADTEDELAWKYSLELLFSFTVLLLVSGSCQICSLSKLCELLAAKKKKVTSSHTPSINVISSYALQSEIKHELMMGNE
jgi:hypothetical protein